MLRLGIKPEANSEMSRHLREFSEVFLFQDCPNVGSQLRKRLTFAVHEDLSQSLKKVSEEIWSRRRKGDSCQQKKVLTCSAGFFYPPPTRTVVPAVQISSRSLLSNVRRLRLLDLRLDQELRIPMSQVRFLWGRDRSPSRPVAEVTATPRRLSDVSFCKHLCWPVDGQFFERLLSARSRLWWWLRSNGWLRWRMFAMPERSLRSHGSGLSICL